LLTGTTATVEVELNGQTHTETPYQYLVDQFAAGNIVAQNATNADKIDIANKSTNSNFDIVFAGSDATSNAALVRDSASRITANPNSGTVNAISFNGSGRSSVETLSLGTSGNGNGFFTSDSGNGRTTFSAGQFYFTNSVSTFINYAPTQIYGDTGVVGQSVFRSNTLSGDHWSITGAGLFTGTGFVGNLTGNATSSTQSLIDNNTSSAAAYPVIWSDGRHSGDGNDNLYKSFGGDGVRNLLFNPSTGILKAKGFEGNADSATTARVQSGSYTGQYDIIWSDTASNANLFRTSSGKMQVQPSTGIITAGGYGRNSAKEGYLHAGNSLAGSTNPIFCTGTEYAPEATTLGTMYGIGYAKGDSPFITNYSPNNQGWGMYVAQGGASRIFLDGTFGNISITGSLYGDVVGNADTSTQVTTTTNGSASFYDLLAHGLTGTGQGASTPTRAASGKLRMRPSDGKLETTGNIEAGGIIHAEDGFTSNGYARLAGSDAGSNHHRGSYGTYVTTDRVHPIWGINSSWKLRSDGRQMGNYYGLSHVHARSYDGMADSSSAITWNAWKNLQTQKATIEACDYAVQWTTNGVCKSLFGETIWSGGDIASETDVIAGKHFGRTHAAKGYLDGGWGSVTTPQSPMPIFCLNDALAPTGDDDLGNMYGVGYGNSSATFITSATPGYGMYVAANGIAKIFLCATDGSISAAGTLHGNYTSDLRTKNTVEVISDASSKVRSLSGNTYYYNKEKDGKGLQYGLIAQEVQEILPEIVNANDEGILRIKTGGLELTALLVEAHKEVAAKVDAQAIMIENMMNRLAALESK
ncbi:MAG: tail fiber domain-containing protein, partial [Phaeodactylibacter sp.]|nr:tail fiber domain-containing protein [Phaeodactylibacter sp.]